MRTIRPISLRSLLVGCVLIVSGFPAVAEEQKPFEEPFNGKLSPGWTWIDEQPGSWRLDAGSLDLAVVPVSEGLFAGGRNTPNLLLREPGISGDFSVEVKLESKPAVELEHAGLILYFDGDNYVVLNKEILREQKIVMVSEKTAKPAVREKAYEHEEVCLRLSVTGKKVISQYRHYDSDPWQTLAELELPVTGPSKVGLLAGRGPKDADHRARFSEFRIVPASGTPPGTAKTDAAKVTSSQPPAKPAPPVPAPPPAPPKKRPILANVPLAVQARQTAERAIPYIEKDGTAWIKDRKCLTCHYVAFMVWSFQDARQRGFDIDKDKLTEWTNWSLGHAKGQGVEGAAEMLLARNRADTSEATEKLIASLRDDIVARQGADGSWNPGGQLPSQKRPLSETKQVSTMWCALALATLDKPAEPVIQSRDKALKWLQDNPPNGKDPAVSSEWYAVRLLVEKQFGDAAQVDALREKILSAQQSDGGWGWLVADKSDAYGTGQTLYALSVVGVPSSHPAIQRAWRFLIETQTDDGSWIVNGTKKETKDKPHPFSSFWGSTWALLGLSHSLPDSVMTAAAP